MADKLDTLDTIVRFAEFDELLTRLADAVGAVEARQLDMEQRDRNRIVVRWPRGVPVDGALLTQLRDTAFDRVVVEL